MPGADRVPGNWSCIPCVLWYLNLRKLTLRHRSRSIVLAVLLAALLLAPLPGVGAQPLRPDPKDGQLTLASYDRIGTVNFLTVPEVTPTNPVVNIVQPYAAVAQSVSTDFGQGVADHAGGRRPGGRNTILPYRRPAAQRHAPGGELSARIRLHRP